MSEGAILPKRTKESIRDDVKHLLLGALAKSAARTNTDADVRRGTDHNVTRLDLSTVPRVLTANGFENTLSVFLAELQLDNQSKLNLVDSERAVPTVSDDLKLVSQRLWHRLERKYEDRMQAYQRARDAKAEQEIGAIKNDYEQRLELKTVELDAEISARQAELRRKEDNIKGELELKFAAEKAHLERDKNALEVEKTDLECKRSNLAALYQDLASRSDKQREYEKSRVEQLNRREAAIRRQELSFGERLEEVSQRIMASERDRYGLALGKLADRERELVRGAEELSEKFERMESFKRDSKRNEELYNNCKQKLCRCEQRNEELLKENRSLLTKLDRLVDYPELQSENVQLKSMVEKLKSEDRYASLKRDFESQLNAAKHQLELTEKAAQLKEQELKLKLENEKERQKKVATDKDALTKRLQKQVEKLKHEKETIAQRSVALLSKKRGTTAPILVDNSSGVVSSSDDFSADSTPELVIEARERLKRLDQVSGQLDQSLAEYRSRRRLIDTVEAALDGRTEEFEMEASVERYQQKQQQQQQQQKPPLQPQVEKQRQQRQEKNEQQQKQQQQPSVSSAATAASLSKNSIAQDDSTATTGGAKKASSGKKSKSQLDESAVPAKMPSSSAAVLTKPPDHTSVLPSWEEKLRAREEERRRRDEEMLLLEQKELQRMKAEEEERIQNAAKQKNDSVGKQGRQLKTDEAQILEPKVPALDVKVDPVMEKYMKIVLEQRTKERETKEKPQSSSPKEEKLKVVEDIEVGEVTVASDDDFQW